MCEDTGPGQSWGQEMGGPEFRKQLSLCSLGTQEKLIALKSDNLVHLIFNWTWTDKFHTFITGNILRPFFVTIISLVKVLNLFHSPESSSSTRGWASEVTSDPRGEAMWVRRWPGTAIMRSRVMLGELRGSDNYWAVTVGCGCRLCCHCILSPVVTLVTQIYNFISGDVCCGITRDQLRSLVSLRHFITGWRGGAGRRSGGGARTGSGYLARDDGMVMARLRLRHGDRKWPEQDAAIRWDKQEKCWHHVLSASSAAPLSVLSGESF